MEIPIWTFWKVTGRGVNTQIYLEMHKTQLSVMYTIIIKKMKKEEGREEKRWAWNRYLWIAILHLVPPFSHNSNVYFHSRYYVMITKTGLIIPTFVIRLDFLKIIFFLGVTLKVEINEEKNCSTKFRRTL